MPTKTNYQKLKDRGVCGRCGKNPPVEGHSICSECLEKLKEKRKSYKSICDKCSKTLICDRDRSNLITECDGFDNLYKRYKDKTKQPIRPTRHIPSKFPYGWCYVCCKQLDNKNSKLCKEHEDWIYLPPKKKGRNSGR